MSDSGFVYVLINPSMPGLVKVGRTNRDPSDRVTELSTATGVPSPFVLVYHAHFSECSRAEEFVHTLLERNGHRVTSNREFFNAPVQEVIDALIKAKSLLESTDSCLEAKVNSPKIQDELPPCDDLFEEALSYYEGRGDTLQDYKKARQLFQQAARLGSPDAPIYLGWIYEYGEGCVEDRDKALEYYEEGAKRGNHWCFKSMAKIFLKTKQPENFQKCWGMYFNSDTFKRLITSDLRKAGQDGFDYLEQVTDNQLPITHIEVLKGIREPILAVPTTSLTDEIFKDSPKMLRFYKAKVRLVTNTLFEGNQMETCDSAVGVPRKVSSLLWMKLLLFVFLALILAILFRLAFVP